MSDYKSGKPIFIGSIVVMIVAVLTVLLTPIGFLVYLHIAIAIAEQEVDKRLNLDYFEALIIRTDNLVVQYNDKKYVNLANGFKEYYSESHETPLGEPSESTNKRYLTVYVSDGKFTSIATYTSNAQEFNLYCMSASYDQYIMSQTDDDYVLGGWDWDFASGSKKFPYNTPIHFDNLIEFLYSQNN